MERAPVLTEPYFNQYETNVSYKSPLDLIDDQLPEVDYYDCLSLFNYKNLKKPKTKFK